MAAENVTMRCITIHFDEDLFRTCMITPLALIVSIYDFDVSMDAVGMVIVIMVIIIYLYVSV